jgi:hypothetical protein
LSPPGWLGLHSGVLMKNLTSLWGFRFYALHCALGILLTYLGGAGITGKKRPLFSITGEELFLGNLSPCYAGRRMFVPCFQSPNSFRKGGNHAKCTSGARRSAVGNGGWPRTAADGGRRRTAGGRRSAVGGRWSAVGNGGRRRTAAGGGRRRTAPDGGGRRTVS